ncbi:MAG: DivIVA domain-containing protein [Gammaproteobacteria bacterium]|nr:DivIVA domain-containing protein [Gammaproteobacteria bacterium]
MSLNPIDIEQKTFRVALRGYAEEEVDAFLDEIVASMRSYEKGLQEAQERVRDLEQRLAETQEAEDRIKKTLVIAQKTADEVVREARFEAQQILSEARLDASEIETEQARRRERLGSEVGMLQGVVAELRAHVRDLTERLLTQVEDVESAMSSVIPAELLKEVEPVSEPLEEESEAVHESDESYEGEEHTSEADEPEDEEGFDEAESGEVYLGSDRRPWERYGD